MKTPERCAWCSLPLFRSQWAGGAMGTVTWVSAYSGRGADVHAVCEESIDFADMRDHVFQPVIEWEVGHGPVPAD